MQRNEAPASAVTVICAGIATVDLTFGLEEFPRAGEKYRAASSDLICGGCGLNSALTVARLGGKAMLATLTGEDFFADRITEQLDRFGVGKDFVIRGRETVTPRSAVIINGKGERMIINYRGDWNHGSYRVKEIGDFDVLMADTRMPGLALPFALEAVKRSKPVVVDGEAPVNEARELLKLATHVAFSEQGLNDYAGGIPAEEALKKARAEFGAWVCVTRGEKPVISFDGQNFLETPVREVVPVDTLGAGDVWHGAFALFIGEGMDESRAVLHANATATLKTLRTGGGAAAPTRNELIQFMENTK